MLTDLLQTTQLVGGRAGAPPQGLPGVSLRPFPCCLVPHQVQRTRSTGSLCQLLEFLESAPFRGGHHDKRIFSWSLHPWLALGRTGGSRVAPRESRASEKDRLAGAPGKASSPPLTRQAFMPAPLGPHTHLARGSLPLTPNPLLHPCQTSASKIPSHTPSPQKLPGD